MILTIKIDMSNSAEAKIFVDKLKLKGFKVNSATLDGRVLKPTAKYEARVQAEKLQSNK